MKRDIQVRKKTAENLPNRTRGRVLFFCILLCTLLISTGCAPGRQEKGTQAPQIEPKEEPQAEESSPGLPVIVSISPEEAANLIEEQKDNPFFAIIDLRSRDEYLTGTLGDTSNVDFKMDNFEQVISGFDRKTPYLIYCSSGHRSEKALVIMKDLGFQEVYNLEGGLEAWSEAGYPITLSDHGACGG